MLDLPTVRDLRRRWKPTKETLAATDRRENLRVRIHRCCSWLRRVEELRESGSDPDATVIYQWAALESLYARWDPSRRRPADERETMPEFLSRLFLMDREQQLVVTTLNETRALALDILTDEFLARYFWDEPGAERARQASRAGARAATWFDAGQHRVILERLLERVELLRNQLVHGASTFGSALNRRALERCTELMSSLLPVILLVVIDHGADYEWSDPCYPPLHLDT